MSPSDVGRVRRVGDKFQKLRSIPAQSAVVRRVELPVHVEVASAVLERDEARMRYVKEKLQIRSVEVSPGARVRSAQMRVTNVTNEELSVVMTIIIIVIIQR